jgi:hypothetical protein
MVTPSYELEGLCPIAPPAGWSQRQAAMDLSVRGDLMPGCINIPDPSGFRWATAGGVFRGEGHAGAHMAAS